MTISEPDRLRMLAPRTSRRRTVLDTDAYNEVDDQFAIVQMMLSPEQLDVEAIYAAPFHNKRSDGPGHGMELSYHEVLRILGRLGMQADGLVHRGVTEYVGFGKQPRPAAAVDDLIARARAGSSGDPLYVVAIGAISNIASALLKSPDIAERIVIVWMGGNAPEWPKSFNQRGDFNFKQDVGAAQVVFDSGVPLVLVPAMGVTSHLHSTVPEIERHVEPHGEIGAFLAQRFKEYSDDHVGWSKKIWDMAPVGWMLNADWAPSVLIPTPIIADDMGWIRESGRHTMRYVAYVDRDPILRDFYAKLSAFAGAR